MCQVRARRGVQQRRNLCPQGVDILSRGKTEKTNNKFTICDREIQKITVKSVLGKTGGGGGGRKD